MSSRPIGISVYGPLIPGARIELQGVGVKELGPNNYILFNIESNWPDTHLFINTDGFEPFSHHVSLPLDGRGRDIILADDGPTGPNIINFPSLTKIGGSNNLTAISVLNREFIVDGQKYKPKMATDFLLVQKKSLGIDITPILKQRKNCGADMLRIFTMAHNIAQFDPHTYDVASVLSTTLDDIHNTGMRAQIEGFADVQFVGLTLDEQHYHHELINQIIINHGNLDLYDLGNEIDKNGIDANNFTKPVGTISSRGSYQNNKPPRAPYWDYGVFHPRRDGDGYYFVKYLADMTPQSELYEGVEGYPSSNMPFIADEPIGFQATIEPGRRNNYPGFAYRLGITYGMFLNGSCFHSTNGIFSEMFDSVTEKCAKAYFKGCDDSKQGW